MVKPLAKLEISPTEWKRALTRKRKREKRRKDEKHLADHVGIVDYFFLQINLFFKKKERWLKWYWKNGNVRIVEAEIF